VLQIFLDPTRHGRMAPVLFAATHPIAISTLWFRVVILFI
jgi:hypothetical protein